MGCLPCNSSRAAMASVKSNIREDQVFARGETGRYQVVDSSGGAEPACAQSRGAPPKEEDAFHVV